MSRLEELELLPHEISHINKLREFAHECSLFLNYDGESFPLSEPCPITLIGNGVRHTVIGGTGSGAVNVRYHQNIEQAFEEAGFTVNSKSWLDSYDKEREENDLAYIKVVKKEAKEHKTIAPSFAMGKVAPEREYEFPIFGDHKVAIYVLSRNEGEGADRNLTKGDVYLTDTEVRDILYLNENYEKFLLVLNTPSIIDLSKIKEVKNILLLSQLGSVTSDVLVDIVLGKVNPSGKLTDSVANISDYPYINTPISDDETRYLEGIYVGYRYFASREITPIYPFGYGLSYTKFDYKLESYSLNGEELTVEVKVINTGRFSGKEVIQLYMSGPSPRPAIGLVSYQKSGILEPKKSETLTLKVKLSDFPIYSEEKESYLLEKGIYTFKFGNSSDSLTDIVNLSLAEDVVLKKVRNVFDKVDFEDLVINREVKKNNKVKTLEVELNSFKCEEVDYLTIKNIEIPEYIHNLKDEELILLSIGDYKTGIDGLIGHSCSLINGGAGETTLRIPSMEYAINMVDGPAGLRVTEKYLVNDKGEFALSQDQLWETLNKYLPAPLPYLLSYKRNLKKKGSVVIQGCTAIPIGTALAQSFSDNVQKESGNIVRKEMEIYGVDVWLAPGVNIHRNILCGRNFEYYSEDPYIASRAASNIISAVQENKSKAVTIKHFACNNIESNRINHNSMVSEKAIREMYLYPFQKAIEKSSPRSIMTAYNLINGIHCSEHKGLILDILRTEWKYEGLVMTDWIKSGQTYKKGNIYPASYASRNIKNGNNISMPGSKEDIKDIKNSLKEGYLSRSELENNATIVFNFINSLKKE